MTLRDSVDVSVGALVLSEDETRVASALVDLALRYAAEIDGADAMYRRAAKLAADVVRLQGPDSALYERVTALEAAVSHRAALVTLGKSLHAALTDLQATPKQRGLKVSAPAAPAGALGKLRAVRA